MKKPKKIKPDLSYKFSFIEINEKDIETCWDFYWSKLNQEDRKYFAPYPLFNTFLDKSQFKSKFIEFQKEKNWIMIGVFNKKNMVGFGHLKKLRWQNVKGEKNKGPNTGLILHPSFRKMGLANKLQKLLIEKAIQKKEKFLYARVNINNIGSLKLHLNLNYVITGSSFLYWCNNKERLEGDVELILNI